MDKSILETVHESAKGFHDAELMDTQTMREFDALCLPPVKQYTGEQIKRIRLNNNVSQSVFAAYLNTSAATVRKWESKGQAHNKPSGIAMKMLSIIDRFGLGILGADEAHANKRSVKVSVAGN